MVNQDKMNSVYIDLGDLLQNEYKHYSYGKSGQDEFCDYFINMIKN